MTRDRNCTVVVDDLVIRYGERTAVDGVSFWARSGQVLAMLGPNGAGKTSTIETLEGYRTPTSGSVKVLGLDPQRDARELSERIGVMLQRNGVYLTMGPRDVLRLFAAYYGDRAANPDALLERVGLGAVASTPWRRLSGGEQQKLSLALALIGQPDVVFLDEPTAMIDPAARTTVRELVRDLRNDGATVVLTTHDLDDAERLADTIVIIDNGRVVAQGSPRDLTAAGADDGVTFSSSDSLDTDALGASVGGAVRRVQQGAYAVAVEPSAHNVAAIASWLASNGHPVGELRAGRRTLEDVFVKLTATANEMSEQTSNTSSRSRRGRR